MIICPNCKTENDEDAKFCKNCGYFFLEENRRIEIRNIKMKSCKSTLTNPHLFACEGDEILFI